MPAPRPRARKSRSSRRPHRRRRWLLYVCTALALSALTGTAVLSYYYLSFTRMIEDRLHGERVRATPRVYGRPIELHVGQLLSQPDLVSRLNDLGYAQREDASRPGEFALQRDTVAISPRGGELAGKVVRVSFPAARRSTSGAVAPAPGIRGLEVVGTGSRPRVRLDAPLLTALVTSGAREKRRHVPLERIPARLQQAVIAVEDQLFYSHPGINPLRWVAIAVRQVFGGDGGGGYSTITQQLARMFFLMDEFNAELASGERSYWRKLREGLMSLVLERRASKDEILELYLNDVYLGQRGSFAIHGVPEAARLFFGKDVANVGLSEAALIAGVIQSPASRSPFSNPTRAVERRNLVLRLMAGEGFITAADAARAGREPLQVVARAVDNEAPYFVDLIGQQVANGFPGLAARAGAIEIHTTLDLNMQRAALDAVRNGLGRVDELLATRRRKAPQPPQAALLAVDPRSGEILALVGGRSYNQSQFNRATTARRQPGSVFKPFVFLAALEYAAREGRTDLTPASLTLDEPATFTVNGRTWAPKNYDEYDGEITWRRALAMSRNLGSIRVGETVGFDRIAALWRRVGVGTPPQGFPSITLGVFELTPFEVAQAYTLFVNGGTVRPLKALDRVESGSRPLRPAPPRPKPVARPDTTFLVTNMMRSVIGAGGTAASARAAGFALDAAGKTGTTNDLRDAWFVGFTPELLTVVWVGYDDNRPLALTGAQAALPIWTEFMRTALAGRPSLAFEPPDGIAFAEIDPETGKLALPGCPGTITESFLAGTEPVEYCPLHGRFEEESEGLREESG